MVSFDLSFMQLRGSTESENSHTFMDKKDEVIKEPSPYRIKE